MWEWRGSNTPVTLDSLLVPQYTGWTNCILGVVVYMLYRLQWYVGGAIYRRCLCRNSLLRELVRRGCVFDHEMRAYAYEYTWVLICCPSPITVTVQISMDTLQCHASHILRTHMCTSTAIVVVMQYAHYGVWCLPKLVQMLISVLGPSNMQYTCSCEFWCTVRTVCSWLL